MLIDVVVDVVVVERFVCSCLYGKSGFPFRSPTVAGDKCPLYTDTPRLELNSNSNSNVDLSIDDSDDALTLSLILLFCVCVCDAVCVMLSKGQGGCGMDVLW